MPAALLIQIWVKAVSIKCSKDQPQGIFLRSRQYIFSHTLPGDEPVKCPCGYWGTPPSCSCFDDNTAYMHNNVVEGSLNKQPSRSACAQSCRLHPDCKFWTWGKESMGSCYLKNLRENVGPGPGRISYVSGSKQCVLPEDEGKVCVCVCVCISH